MKDLSFDDFGPPLIRIGSGNSDSLPVDRMFFLAENVICDLWFAAKNERAALGFASDPVKDEICFLYFAEFPEVGFKLLTGGLLIEPTNKKYCV